MLTIAAILIVFTAGAHSFLGEKYILIRLFKRGNLPHLLGSDEFTKGTLRFAWHITSVFWLALAVVLAAEEEHSSLLLYCISLASLISALLAAYFTKGKHLSWLVFAAIAVLTYLSAAS